jgi:hypothetical protein
VDRSKLVALNDLLHMKRCRLQLTPIADHQLPARYFTGSDHRFCFLGGRRHRLLTQNMLSSARSPDGVLRMHPVWQPNVNGINSGILANTVELVMRVDGTSSFFRSITVPWT